MARQYLDQSLTVARELDDNWYISYPLSALANTAFKEGDLKQARTLAEEGLHRVRDIGDRNVIVVLEAILGDVACQEKEYAVAHLHFCESLTLRQHMGQVRAIAEMLNTFADLAVAQIGVDPTSAGANQRLAVRAARLLGAAEALLGATRHSVSSSEGEEHTTRLDKIRTVLPQDAFDSAWAAGKSMKLEEAAVFARQQET